MMANDSTTDEHSRAYIVPVPSEIDDKFISDEVLFWAEVLGHMGLTSAVSIFGIVANIINIIVFIRQGPLSDSNTVSLLALSTSDLFALVFLLWTGVCFMILYIRPPSLPYSPMDVLYLTGGRVHLMFVQITSWVTVYIAFERCMCVLFPFKVRTLFTAKRAAFLLSSLFLLIIFVGYLPYYFFQYLVWRKDPNTNRSILVTHTVESKLTIILIVLNAFISKFLTFFLVCTFTQITVCRVNASTKWRKITSSSTFKNMNRKTEKPSGADGRKDDNNINETENSTPSDINVKEKAELGSRERRLTKMITVISVMFIICLVPDMVFVVLERIEPQIKPGMKYHNLFFFCYAISFFLEGLNSSVNIFVYYNMSTKYRCEFRKLFGMDG